MAPQAHSSHSCTRSPKSCIVCAGLQRPQASVAALHDRALPPLISHLEPASSAGADCTYMPCSKTLLSSRGMCCNLGALRLQLIRQSGMSDGQYSKWREIYRHYVIRMGRHSIHGCRAVSPGHRRQLQPRDAQHIMLVACQGLPAHKRLHVLPHSSNVSLSHATEGFIYPVRCPTKVALPELEIWCNICPAACHQAALAPP
jgi:hypothetical protein